MGKLNEPAAASKALSVTRPRVQTLPVVVASPHSGREYPDSFVAASALDAASLRRSEDAFVDRIAAGAPVLGAPLLAARFPRAMLDVNREAWELDPDMFEERLPPWVNARSPRVAAGLGTIARIVGGGAEIYRDKLRFAEAERRVQSFWRPYHGALEELISQTRARFGFCVLIDCHSMPSVAGPGERDAGVRRADVVLGDCYGTSCAPAVTAAAEQALKAEGLRVARNEPYAGGFTTRNYGQPREGAHAIQVEINRGLYLDEARLTPTAGLAAVAAAVDRLVAALGALRLPARDRRQMRAAAE